MAGIHWTTQDDLLLERLCEEGKTNYKDMVKFFSNRTVEGIYHHAKWLGLKNKFDATRDYFYDKTFWGIPNKVNSFYSGWLASDGCVLDRGNGKYTIACYQHPQDGELIEWFKKDAKISNPIHDIKTKKGHVAKQMRINVYDDWIVPLKEHFSVTPRKTYTLQPPNISDDLIPYYLIGFIHGDGCWSKHKYNNLLYLSFASASPGILNWINLWVTKNFTSKKRNRLREVSPNLKNYQLHIGGDVAEQLYNYLVSLNTPLLKRKWFNPKLEGRKTSCSQNSLPRVMASS